MRADEINFFLTKLRSEIAPALGCTEPAAAALCAAGAAAGLQGAVPECVTLEVSEYILKNAMNVGIPGTKEVGLEAACAMGAAVAKPEKCLLILEGMSPEEKEIAERLAGEGRIRIMAAKTSEKVYLRAVATGGGHRGEAVICGTHANFLYRSEDGVVKYENREKQEKQAVKTEQAHQMTVAAIWAFVQEAEEDSLAFLDELVRMNLAIAEEGLQGEYGLQVGKSVLNGGKRGILGSDLSNHAIAVTASGADARMSGCEKAVMSVAGSGNQGLTATLPIIAVARENPAISQGKMWKALAMSILVTVHAKHYIGRLSVLCGCSIAAAIGVVAGMVYLFDGTLPQAELGIKTMTADIAGMVCDGAKPGCALKIATSVSAAMRAASLALSGIGANSHDGIVARDVEQTLKNLGELGNEGMADTNVIILDMLLHKNGTKKADIEKESV